jgi:succinyl-CoA synthetase beta subunit
MNIEEVAASDPAAIITTPIAFKDGLSSAEAIELANKLGFAESNKAAAAKIFQDLYTIFKDKDATQIEINPLAETEDGAVIWLVGKFLAF